MGESGGPRGTPAPFDLRAVERDLHQTWPDREGLRVMYDHAMALLAHARALRAALAHTASSLDHLMAFKGSRLEETQRAGHELNITRARAVLGAAQDGPA